VLDGYKRICFNHAMKLLPYLDIHTHRRLPHEDSVSVDSLSIEELKLMQTSREYSTAGIHPWWLEDYTQDEISELQNNILKLLQAGKVWGIGETGLDRTMPELMDRQLELFFWHLDLAHQFELPLVIHNVRSGSDFLGVMKEKKPNTPWIFHDFRGNEEMVKSLLRLHPDCYFSFGISLDNSPQIRELLPVIPLENLFLETDDQKHLDIHDIYLRASQQLGLDLDFLKSQIWHNFKKITRFPQ